MGAELNNIPKLDGWVNLTEAAEMLGITRQHAFKKARQADAGLPNGWKTIHRVGSKPMYVVSTSEIVQLQSGEEDTTDLEKGTTVRAPKPLAEEPQAAGVYNRRGDPHGDSRRA